MKSITRSVFLVGLVVVAISATGTASASAAEWHVGGNALTGSASLVAETKPVAQITIYFPGSIEIKCENLELTKADIASPNSGETEHLVFTGCSSSISGCSVPEEIKSEPLKLEAALGSKSPEDTLLLKPVTGALFMEFKVGGSCGFAGVHKIVGKAKSILPKGREELAEQELLVRAGEDELYPEGGGVGIKFLAGAEKVKLTSGKDWSFR